MHDSSGIIIIREKKQPSLRQVTVVRQSDVKTDITKAGRLMQPAFE